MKKNINPNSAETALTVMAAHIKALNLRDEKALAATLHFPHYRLSENILKIWETPEAYFSDFRKRAGGDWHHSAFGELNVITADENKVHLDVRVDRFRADDSLLISFRSLWVLAQIDGVWAAHLRSSFAPDSMTGA